MPLYSLICILLVSVCNIRAMQSDDNNPMTSSWVIINKAGKSANLERPELKDLHTLAHAAHVCTRTMHGQIGTFFSRCNIPLIRSKEPQCTLLLEECSAIDALLNTLQCNDHHAGALCVVENYEPSGCSPKSMDDTDDELSQMHSNLATEFAHSSVTLAEATEQPVCNQPSTETSISQEEEPQAAASFLQTVMRYPLAPFSSVISFMRRPTPKQSPPIIEKVDKEDPALVNAAKYDKALSQGKMFLKALEPHKSGSVLLLTALKKQLILLHTQIARNLAAIEHDRSCFMMLQQCMVENLSLNDAFLLQYSKMTEHGAAVEDALFDFFGDKNRKLTDITQEEYEACWQAIQDRHARHEITQHRFNQLRQYSYALQTTPSRFIAQAFIDGTINNYGIPQKRAQEIGLTPERIEELTIEFSNCKSFLQQLHKAFTNSLKIIEDALQHTNV